MGPHANASRACTLCIPETAHHLLSVVAVALKAVHSCLFRASHVTSSLVPVTPRHVCLFRFMISSVASG